MRTIAMAITGVAFTAYPVTDMARAVAFYSDSLGLTKAGLESGFWVEFDVAGSTFGVGTFEQIGSPGSAQSFALEVSDLAALRADLAAKGHEPTEPFETPVCFISVVRDPDGNQIFLHQSKPH
jgi:predicted enzyme related to lactoylglutathione lyase